VAYPINFPGPFAQLPDGYSEQVRGVLAGGHVMVIPTGYCARDRLIDLDAAVQERRNAFACLDTIISSQIGQPDPSSLLDPRGTWHWSVNDTTRTGHDFNFADFLGTAFLQVLHNDTVPEHSDWPAGLMERLKQCLVNCVECSRKRHVRISYTNPVAMSIECAALAGELLGIPEYVEYARTRLQEWIDFTEKAGTFEEFNSNTYGGVTLPHLATLVERVRNRDVRSKALHMERKYLDHICDFYHHPTRETCMPRSREYQDHFDRSLLHDYLYHVLQRKRPGELPWPADRSSPHGLGVVFSHAADRQLDKLLGLFRKPKLVQVFAEWVGVDHVGPLDQVPPKAAGEPTRRRQLTTWRTDEFCIGSVNEIDSWHQRRSVGGFIRARAAAEAPSGAKVPTAMVAWKPYIAVAGADTNDQKSLWPTMMYFNLCSGQEEGTVLAAISPMPVDNGWLCGSHWRQKVAGKVSGVSADFGFEIDGIDAESLPPLEIGKCWRLEVGQATISLLFMGGFIGSKTAKPAIVRTENGWRISLLKLENFELDWAKPPEAGLGFVLDISPRGSAPKIADAALSVSGTRVNCQARVGKKLLVLRYDPPKIEKLTSQACFFSVQAK
jgi:hypothetical protein